MLSLNSVSQGVWLTQIGAGYRFQLWANGSHIPSAQVVKVESNKYVVNMFAQEYYGYDGKRYTSYDALDTCLKKVAKICEEEGIKKVTIPYNMSCDRGGASWNVVVCLIEEAFKNKKINIELCKYGEK